MQSMQQTMRLYCISYTLLALKLLIFVLFMV